MFGEGLLLDSHAHLQHLVDRGLSGLVVPDEGVVL